MTPEQHKFLVKLFGYEYEIVYRTGKDNKVADALLRKEDSSMLRVVYHEDGPTLNAISSAEWHI